MANIKEKGSQLLEAGADYIETSLQMYALKTASKSAKVASGFLTSVILATIFVFSFLLISIGFCLLLSIALHRWWAGFLIVGGVYTVLGLVINSMRRKMITKPLLNKIIPAILSAEELAEQKIEKMQDQIEDRLHLERQPD